MRSDDGSSYNDRQGIGEVPRQPPQSCIVPGPGHYIDRTSNSHRAVDEAQRHCGHHLSFPRGESDDEANAQKCNEMSDVKTSRCEEPVRAEVMLEDLVSLKHCKYRGVHPRGDKLPQQGSSHNGRACHPWGSAEANARKLWDSFYRLSPIPSSRGSHTRFGREEREFFKQVTED